MFRDGCKPPYSTNTSPYRMSRALPQSGDSGGIRSTSVSAQNQWFDTSYPHAPWRCIATEPGFRPPQISDGLAAATGNCIPGNNSCNSYHCWNPNFYNWHLQQVSSGTLSPAQAFSTMPPAGARPTNDLSRCTSFRITRFGTARATTQFLFSTSLTSTSQGGLGTAITRSLRRLELHSRNAV